MKYMFVLFSLLTILSLSCDRDDEMVNTNGIQGYDLLTELSGHWVGTNETSFGTYDWFAFDFRPISVSHLHSIYEGGTNQNIITSVFIADFEGKKQIMARNGGWLGNQYRATYFVLDKAETNNQTKYYRLVDAVGRENRAYMEFRFKNGTLEFDAYKDNSGSLDQPVHHMGFKGTNYNPTFAQAATDLFNYPQEVAEVDLNDKFVNLIDPDSALFLEESDDPFPKSQHGHISDLTIDIARDASIADKPLLLYISTESLVSADGTVDLTNVDRKVVRTIDVQATEAQYTTTYLHPDNYFITAFADLDGNFFPSAGDLCNVSQAVEVGPDMQLNTAIDINQTIQ